MAMPSCLEFFPGTAPVILSVAKDPCISSLPLFVPSASARQGRVLNKKSWYEAELVRSQTLNSTRAVSATRARSFSVTTRISCRSIASTPNRYRSIASSSVSETARNGSTTAVNSSRAASTLCTPSTQLRSRISQPLRRLHIPLQRYRLEHPNHPIRPVSTINLHRIARPRIQRRRDPLPHQPPHPSPLKLRSHRPRNRRTPCSLPLRLHLQRLDIHLHQLLNLRRKTLRQARPHLGHLHRVRQRVLEHLHHRLDSRSVPPHRPQPRPDLSLQRLQQTDIRISVHASDPRPVPRKTHHRAIAAAPPPAAEPRYSQTRPSPHPAHTESGRTRIGPAPPNIPLSTASHQLSFMNSNSSLVPSAKRHSSHYKFSHSTYISKLSRHYNFLPRRPHREWLAIRIPKLPDQLPHPRPPPQHLFHQPLDHGRIPAIPLRRHRLRDLPQRPRLHRLNPAQPRFKALPPRHPRVHLLRWYTPRSGESGNVHSPALKQNP